MAKQGPWTKLDVRLAMPADAKTLVEFIKLKAEHEQQTANPTEKWLARQLEQGANPPIHAFIAQADRKPVGCVIAYPSYVYRRTVWALHVGHLYVLDTHRRCGIAGMLIGALAGKVRNYSYHALVEFEISQRDPGALAFYRSIGAKFDFYEEAQRVVLPYEELLRHAA
ncbi:MAG TPA: GNAT family N-acetyltransferase [Candidatus Paceibacterota bacterium]|jgi:GNAT superfamily N-acetyltransferase|nr:GNAT family N-acetyltransferase [Candidatus Paceibacterota bacterium]